MSHTLIFLTLFPNYQEFHDEIFMAGKHSYFNNKYAKNEKNKIDDRLGVLRMCRFVAHQIGASFTKI